jgi:molybdopterin-guanine dinucleotide biosynthesis protein A
MAAGISGTILAGGTGSRLNGVMKPKIVIEGETIISRILSVIRDIFDEIIIVANNPDEFAEFNYCTIVQDQILKAGPLGGIHAALKASSDDAIFVFAGDMPYPDKDLIIRMIEDYHSSGCDVLIPRIEEFIEPLHAIYSISLAENLDSYLMSGKSCAARDYIKSLNVKYFQLEMSETNKRAFTNINSPSDLDRPVIGNR